MLSRAKFLVVCQKYWPVVLSCLSNLWWVAPHVTQKSHCVMTFSAECLVAYCFQGIAQNGNNWRTVASQEQRMWQQRFWNHSPRTHFLKSISWLTRKQRSGIGADFIMNVRRKNFMAMRLTFLLLASIYVVGGTSSASDSKWGFVSFKIVKR